MTKFIYRIIGLILILVGIYLAIELYNWELALIIILIITGNSMEERANY